MCVHIIVHNCHTQHSTEQFWWSSLLSARQATERRCCLLEGRRPLTQQQNLCGMVLPVVSHKSTMSSVH